MKKSLFFLSLLFSFSSYASVQIGCQVSIEDQVQESLTTNKPLNINAVNVLQSTLGLEGEAINYLVIYDDSKKEIYISLAANKAGDSLERTITTDLSTPLTVKLKAEKKEIALKCEIDE